MPNLALVFKFWDQKIAFYLLMVSTVSTFITISSQAIEHFSFIHVHCPHHTWLACVIAYLNHIHCPHLAIPGLQKHQYADTNLNLPSMGVIPPGWPHD